MTALAELQARRRRAAAEATRVSDAIDANPFSVQLRDELRKITKEIDQLDRAIDLGRSRGA